MYVIATMGFSLRFSSLGLRHSFAVCSTIYSDIPDSEVSSRSDISK